jgi:DNA-binding beta-propeller fold protein YncE
VSGAPFDVAVTASNIALVTRGHAAAVDVLTLDGQPRVARTIPVGPVPTRVVPSAQGDWACVTSQFSEAINIVDLRQGRLVAAIHVGGHPLGAVLSNDGQTLYVTTNCDRLVAVSLSRRSAVTEIAIPHGSPQLCSHPSGRRLYAAGWRAGVVAEIEVPALRVLRTFKLGGIVQEVAVTVDGQSLYVANEAGWLDVVHLPTGKRSATVKLGTAALGLALSADDADLIVGLLHAGEVLVLDRHTLDIRRTLHTGGRPRLMATHPKWPVLVANEAGWVDFIY